MLMFPAQVDFLLENEFLKKGEKNINSVKLWEINGLGLGQVFPQKTTANWKCDESLKEIGGESCP